jgi:hypothetical protein
MLVHIITCGMLACIATSSHTAATDESVTGSGQHMDQASHLMWFAFSFECIRPKDPLQQRGALGVE